MAKLKKPTEADLSAMMSNNVVPRLYRNQWIISVVTVPRKSESEKRQKVNEDFGDASKWAKEMLKKPGMKELYSRGIKGKMTNAHQVAVKDYKHAPEIHYVRIKEYSGAIGDEFRVKATDDFLVISVHIRIFSKEGKLLEDGEAVRYGRKPNIWVYKTTVLNPNPEGTLIRVRAEDRPGNGALYEVRIENKTNDDTKMKKDKT